MLFISKQKRKNTTSHYQREEKSYVAGQVPGLHGVHGLLIDAFVVALHVADVLFLVLVLSRQNTRKPNVFQQFFPTFEI